jgi:nicotinamidase-related amidase
MRSLIEVGFEVMVVTDATAEAITEFYDGYAASLTYFSMIASKVDNTDNTLAKAAEMWLTIKHAAAGSL